jgi:hypothetical protein
MYIHVVYIYVYKCMSVYSPRGIVDDFVGRLRECAENIRDYNFEEQFQVQYIARIARKALSRKDFKEAFQGRTSRRYFKEERQRPILRSNGEGFLGRLCQRRTSKRYFKEGGQGPIIRSNFKEGFGKEQCQGRTSRKVLSRNDFKEVFQGRIWQGTMSR